MTNSTKLLTADRIGLGLVALGTVGAVVNLPMLALASLGVLGPPVLRELGWLNDDDDFTRQAAHKAGFQTMVLLMALLVADRLLMRLGDSLPPAFGGDGLYYPLENTISTGLAVFAVSYVMQYWGVRVGAVRVIVGVGVLTALTGVSNILLGLRFGMNRIDFGAFLIVPVILLLALLVHRRPRLGGGLILALVGLAVYGLGRMLAGLDSMPDHVRQQGMFWGLMTAVISLVVIFGPVGLALLRDRDVDG